MVRGQRATLARVPKKFHKLLCGTLFPIMFSLILVDLILFY